MKPSRAPGPRPGNPSGSPRRDSRRRRRPWFRRPAAPPTRPTPTCETAPGRPSRSRPAWACSRASFSPGVRSGIMSQGTPVEPRGLLAALGDLAATLVAMAHTRLDLLATDLEEDRDHLL